jgi:hypothetical protein
MSEQDENEQQAMLPFVDDDSHIIRRQWHDGRWYFSVIDVVAYLTDSKDPGNY